MALNGSSTRLIEYHFDRTGTDGTWTTATNATGAVSFTANVTKGAQLQVTANADRAAIHFNGKLAFPIDDILHAEFLFQIVGWDDTTDGFIGFGSAFNADPDAVQEWVGFRIAGGTTGRNLNVETDDNVTNLDDQFSGIVLPDTAWIRAGINFNTGGQSIAPPGSSLPGKSSIKFTCTDENGYCQHIQTAQHMTMNGYAGGLQPLIGMRQTVGNAGAAVTMYVKRVSVLVRDSV